MVAAVGACGNLAQAQKGPASSAEVAAQPTTRDAAAAHFEIGRRHYADRRFREALREFQLARAAVPAADLWYNIARCHEALGEYELAIDGYETYLRDRVDAPDAEWVRNRIARLRTELEHDLQGEPQGKEGTLRIDSNLSGVLVSLDGAVLGTSPIDRTLTLAPGQHRLDATHPGYLPFRAAVSVSTGSLSAAYLDLRPDPGRRLAEVSHTWTWIFGGAASLALLTSGGLATAAALADGDRGARAVYWEGAEFSLAGGVALTLAAIAAWYMEDDRRTYGGTAPDSYPPARPTPSLTDLEAR